MTASPAHAVATFTVNQTGDAPDANPFDDVCDTNLDALPRGLQCTLRAAIEEANFTPNSGGPDLINFSIQGNGPHTIAPTSELPSITDPVTIDGYSEPGASPNTLRKGNNAVLLIELDGSDAGTGEGADGLVIVDVANCVIRGLVVNRFDSSGIVVTGDPTATTGNRIEGNFVGTNPSGNKAFGNGEFGVVLNTDANTLGGTSPEARNVISGNGGGGVRLGSPGTANKVEGNFIGTKKNVSDALGNEGDGVQVGGAADSTIGGTLPGAANTIAFNDGGVVLVRGPGPSFKVPTGDRILRNSIFSNRGLGIDLNGDGPTANDGGTADDTDEGPNGLQNTPALSSAITRSDKTTVRGVLDTKPNTPYTVQFFSQANGNEGKKFIGEKQVPTDEDGRVDFTFRPANALTPGQKVTATATGPEGTSEFSTPLKVTTS